MSDNLNRRQPEDPKKINKNQSWEIEYWCKELDCTKDTLLAAIEEVGPNVEDVKKYLGH